MALASIGAADFARLIIWLSPGDTANWTWSNIPLALAAITPDMILIALLLICKIIADKVLAGRWRTLADYGLASIFWLLILVSAANLMSFLVMRAPLDLGWLRYLNARDAQTVGAMMTSAVTPKRVALVMTILFILPILAIQLVKYARVLQKSLTLFVCSAVLTTGCAVAGFTLSETTDPLKDHSRRSGSIFTVLRKAFFPPNTLRYLNGETGISPGAESNVDLADWQSKPAGTDKPCCVGMNIVQITIDSVPRRNINPDYILRNAALYPNLARLYREGIGYTTAYSNRPSSAAALAVMALSDYPQNWWQRTSDGGLRLGDGDSLSAQLIRKGYEASHFMSGQVNYGGLRDRTRQGRTNQAC